MSRLARPYAQALLGAAGSLDEAERIEGEIAQFLEMMREAPALGKMAVNPAVPMEVKERILAAVSEAAEFAPVTRRLLKALLARHRLSRLGEIHEGVVELVHRERGIVVAEVESAEPLDDAARSRLSSVLESKLGQKVQLELAVDPGLLAGFVVRIGSNYYDASVKGQLDRLTADLARV